MSKTPLLTAAMSIMLASCLNFDSRHDKSETILENFKKREKEIINVADYFWKLKPANNEIYFKADGNRYSITIALPRWSINNGTSYVDGIEAKINSRRMAAFLKKQGWTVSQFETLKDLLEKANCPSIKTDEDFIQLYYSHSDITSDWYFIKNRPYEDSVIRRDSALGVRFLNKRVRIGSASIL